MLLHLQKIIFGGVEIGAALKMMIVVAGTPDVGKSVFNFCLLYVSLLRL